MAYDITTKDGITIRNIPDEISPDSPEIRQRVAKIRGQSFRPLSNAPAPIQSAKEPVDDGRVKVGDPGFDPTEGMSTTQKVLAGAGKAFVDVGRGVGQRVGIVTPQEIDESRTLEAPLMRTGAGRVGNLIGNVAAFAPAAMIPWANTVAGGATIGALTGALQPTGSGESVTQNMGTGALAGGLVPAAVNTAKAAKATIIDPFTEAGRTRIAGGLINRAAADPQAAYARLQTAQGATPGFMPTVGQAADDSGLASLERTVRAINPKAFDSVDSSQRSALADAVRGVAKDDIARKAAIDSRDTAVSSLYDKAKRAVVSGDSEFESLLQRPTIASGARKAEEIAADEGRKFALSKGAPAEVVSSPVLDANGLPVSQSIPSSPATYSGQGLHDLKLGIDAAIQDANGGLSSRVSGSQVSAKNAYLDWMDKKIPEYAQARQTYADMSRPINQMDIGNDFLGRLVPALYRDMPAPQQLNAAAYARALADNGDDIARNVTGLKGARLADVMEPDQMGTLQGVAQDLQRMKVAENAGRGPGSDTIQKAAMSHIAAQAGIPNWAASVMRVPGGWMKRAGDVLYGNSDEQVRQMLADMLANPQQAAQAMKAAGVSPSKVGAYLKAASQSAALAAPASMAARAE